MTRQKYIYIIIFIGWKQLLDIVSESFIFLLGNSIEFVIICEFLCLYLVLT